MGVVESGHKIYVSSSGLADNEVTVKWQQNLREQSRQYYLVTFYNKDQGNEQSILFIQKDFVDSFKNKKTSGDDYTVIVDGSFQYGQSKDQTKRWLVYHDKSSIAYQWRFISSALHKLDSNGANFAEGFLKPYISNDLRMVQEILGLPLRNF